MRGLGVSVMEEVWLVSREKKSNLLKSRLLKGRSAEPEIVVGTMGAIWTGNPDLG